MATGMIAIIWNVTRNCWAGPRSDRRNHTTFIASIATTAAARTDTCGPASCVPPKNGSRWYGSATITRNRSSDAGDPTDESTPITPGAASSRPSGRPAQRAAAGRRVRQQRGAARERGPAAEARVHADGQPEQRDRRSDPLARRREQRGDHEEVGDGLGLERAEHPVAADERLVGDEPQHDAAAAAIGGSPIRPPSRTRSQASTVHERMRPTQPNTVRGTAAATGPNTWLKTQCSPNAPRIVQSPARNDGSPTWRASGR